MAHEIYTICLGQAGNRIGFEFWDTLRQEHGIHADGSYERPEDFNRYSRQPISTSFHHNMDCKEIFFNETNDDRYVPRTLMVDLEPRVVNSILTSHLKDIFNGSVYVDSKGGGASNSWACGYDQAQYISEQLFDRFDDEIEFSDCFDGFLICHSVGGGTGSGVGSYILDNLNDHYPKKNILTFSVVPTTNSSNVVVEAYNSMLTYSHLNQNATGVVCFDNLSLHRACSKVNDEDSSVCFDHINRTIAHQMSLITAMLRFPGPMYHPLSWILSELVVLPQLNFFLTSMVPIEANHHLKKIKSCKEAIKRLKKSSNMLLYAHPNLNKDDRYIGLVDILQGNLEVSSINQSKSVITDENLVDFVDWRMGGAGYQIIPVKNSPYSNESKTSGMMVANNTCMKYLFMTVLEQYKKLKSRGAYLDQYRSFSMFKNDLSLFDSTVEDLTNLLDEYKIALASNAAKDLN